MCNPKSSSACHGGHATPQSKFGIHTGILGNRVGLHMYQPGSETLANPRLGPSRTLRCRAACGIHRVPADWSVCGAGHPQTTTPQMPGTPLPHCMVPSGGSQPATRRRHSSPSRRCTRRAGTARNASPPPRRSPGLGTCIGTTCRCCSPARPGCPRRACRPG